MNISIEALRGKMLFLGLTDAQLQSVAKIVRRRVLRPGEVVVRRGELDDTLSIIERGAVEMRVPKGEGGAEVVTAVFEPGSYVDESYGGDFFGEFSLLDLAPWSATVVSRERTVLYELNRDALYDLFSADIDLQIGLILNIARALCRRLRGCNRESAGSNKPRWLAEGEPEPLEASAVELAAVGMVHKLLAGESHDRESPAGELQDRESAALPGVDSEEL